MTTYDTTAEKSIVTEADPKVLKRAQFEAYEFELEAPSLVRVTNDSHADPSDHSYLVNVEDGVPVVCQCKADQYHDGPCKHRVAIGIREPVMTAAQDQQAVATDGGSTIEPQGSNDEDRCRHGQQGCCGPDGDELPCWGCYRSDKIDG